MAIARMRCCSVLNRVDRRAGRQGQIDEWMERVGHTTDLDLVSRGCGSDEADDLTELCRLLKVPAGAAARDVIVRGGETLAGLRRER
jgi:hypothetical protein